MSQAENLKRTPVFSEHEKLGGKLVPFAGWEMPVQYEGVIAEHNQVRTKCGIFDVSHMGEISVKGPDSLGFVNYLITNDASTLVDGQVLYTPMLYEDGGIVDDLLVYRKSSDDFLLVVNASNSDKDFAWIEKVLSESDFKVQVENISDSIAEFAVQGPLSESILNPLTDFDLNELGFFHFVETQLSGHSVLISRTGYTGEDGFEIYMSNSSAVELWNLILGSGSSPGDIKPIGLGARDTLRFESRLMLYGNDITKDTHPFEAGLKWTVKMKKGDFMGKSSLEKFKDHGLTRRLVGFEMIDRGIPRHGYKLFKDGEEIGFVTSGTFAPYLKKNLGLGYVKYEHRKKGTEIQVEVRGKMLSARIVSTPFYKREKEED